MVQIKLSAGQLAEKIGGIVDGDANVMVSRPAKIEEATSADFSFIANPKYRQFATTTEAAILIVGKDFEREPNIGATLIKVEGPYLAFATLLSEFKKQVKKQGIEQPSFIAPSAKYAEDVYIGAFSYVSENAVIEPGVQAFPQVFIGENVKVGEGTIIHPGAKIYRDCVIGKNCIIHAGAVIGGDGFGFAPQADGSFKKIPQTGNVVLEDNVEIGANATIDRATVGSTVIKKGAKIDNLVQLAHNVEIGESSVVAAQAGISGSSKLGKYCQIGGQAGIVGHLTLADGTKVNAQSGVIKSVKSSGTAITDSPAFEFSKAMRSQVVYRKLPELEQRISKIEKSKD